MVDWDTYVDIRNIMGLIHNTEDDLRLRSVFLRKLSPKAHKLGICGSTLSNNTSVPLFKSQKVERPVSYKE